MTDNPEFIDNRDGNTLAHALNRYLGVLEKRLDGKPDLDIATGYFNPRGYFALQDGISRTENVRVLLGADVSYDDREQWFEPGDRERDYEQERVDEALQSLREDLERDRDLLGFSLETDRKLQDLVSFLESDHVEVRRYEEGFLHGKAFLFSHQQGVIAGSSNFTGAGLTSNLELNLGRYQPHVTSQVEDWFEDLWAASEQYPLAEIYKQRFKAYSPYLIYLRVLWERYKDELEAEEELGGEISLAPFQEDGVRRVKRFLSKYGGAVLADEVGLGKTYVAAKVLEEVAHENRQKALVIAPAYLRDGMWTAARRDWMFQFDIISYSQLRDWRALGGDRTYNLAPPEDYKLVVIDEAHAFRNPQTDQADALRHLLRAGPSKNLILLTATPVNNSLWDLYHLLHYFIGHDAVFAPEGIPNLRDQFHKAQRQDPSELSPDLLFDVLDHTTVRRTRGFIETHYEGATLPDGRGNEIPVRFPDTVPVRVEYSFSDTFGDDFFESVSRGLAGGEHEEPELTLSRYQPSRYLDGDGQGGELSMVGLLRTGLLKRFESSSKAFALTLSRMVEQYDRALDLVDRGVVPTPDALEEWVETDTDEALDEVFEEADVEDVQELPPDKREQLRSDLETDRAILSAWKERAESIEPREDRKLQALKRELKEIKRQAEDDAITEEEAKRNRKVVIFTYFDNTVDWILDYLQQAVDEDEELACYRDRIVGVSGKEKKNDVSREEAVYGFAPETTGAPEGFTEDHDYDILVATDVLGQGVNLQQARHVINFDLPWNPMRVVQRNGRVNRLNSPHSKVYARTVFPEDRLEELLSLEETVRRKLAQAARSIGLEDAPIPEVETVEQNFADRREEIQAFHDEDDDAYEEERAEASALSGEEFRQELREGLQDYGDEIESLPWAAGSGLRGDKPGYFYCAKVGREEERLFLRFVPLDETEEIVTDTLPCLRRIMCSQETERVLTDEMKEGVYAAWEQARHDIYNEWLEKLDPQQVQPEVPRAFREAAEHVDNHRPDRSEQEIRHAIEAIGAPRDGRLQRVVRGILDQDADPLEISRELMRIVEEYGLEPMETPEPWPPIAEEDIKLVCWMAVAPADTEEEDQGTTLQAQTTLPE